ncbi:MAG TPA: hypothetical protein VMT38_04385 [Terracidiphilus sp.]|nr:hypothetical protein [Terracidiphilus sp.]
MTDSSSQPASQTESFTGSLESTELPNTEPTGQKNAALERCMQAWDRSYHLASINPDDDSLEPDRIDADEQFAREQGAISFRDAMPLPDSYQNVRDFLTCITYGMLNKILSQDDCRDLLRVAAIALSLFKAQSRSEQPDPKPADQAA